MKQDAAKARYSSGFFMLLSGAAPVRIVCAALVLASFASLFRIVSIW